MTHTITIWTYRVDGTDFHRYDFDGTRDYNRAYEKYRDVLESLFFHRLVKQVDVRAFDVGDDTREYFGAHNRFPNGAQVWIRTSIVR